MILAGMDPSFRRTGISIYKDGKVFITSFKIEPNADKSFMTVWHDADNQSVQVSGYLESNRVEQLISEVPPPQGQFASGLWGLDCLLMARLKFVKTLYCLYPTYVGHVHGKRTYSKTESVILATKMIESLSDKIDFSSLPKRINHDEAESFIFLCRLFVINGMFEDELMLWKGLFSKKEHLLW